MLKMVDYINSLQEQIVKYIATEVSSNAMVQGEDEEISISLQRGAIIVRKDINFKEEGTFYIFTRSPEEDIILARALGRLHADKKYSVLRHDAGNGKIRYFIEPSPGIFRDEDLGDFEDGETLATLLEAVPSTGDNTDTIIERSAYMGRPLSQLPNWTISDVDRKKLH